MDLKKDFVTVSPSDGGGNASVNITADVNASYQPRETRISVNPANGTAKEVTISQNGIPYIVHLGFRSNNVTADGDMSSFQRLGGAPIAPHPVMLGTVFRPWVANSSAMITALFGCLNSFNHPTTGEDIILQVALMASDEVELSSFYTTFTYEDDDGLDWSNYIVAKTLEELDYSSYTNDAKYLYVQVGFGRRDTGIENEQILMEYRLAIVNTH